MTMQRRQRTHGLLGTAAAAVLLAMTLGLAGCGSDGDDGAQGPPGPPGQDATTVTGAAAGVDSPNASLCYSCHQHVDESGLIRAHINALGGEMYGFGTHMDEGAEGCSTCHGGMRPGGTHTLSDSPLNSMPGAGTRPTVLPSTPPASPMFRSPTVS
jgi:hypothetical protein